MKHFLRAALLASACLAAPAGAQTVSLASAAPQSASIAAVVNGQVITSQDVYNRARLLAISTGMNPTPDVITRLSPQVTKQLIDQTLEQQEIAKRNVTVSDDDVAQAVAHIEQGNNMPAGGLRQRLAAVGVPFSTLLAQIRTQLGWQQVLHQVLGPGLQPTPGDMNAEKAALKATIGSTQYHLAEIFIPVTGPDDEVTARNFTNTVIAQLRAGAPFPVIAAQFSQDQTALSGGDLGYVQLSQLDAPVAATVSEMPVGAISNPIRVPGGYEVVQLLDKHEVGNQPQTVLNIRQAYAPYPTPITSGQVGPAQAAVINQLVAKSHQVQSCDDMTALNATYGNVRPADPGPVNLATVTPPAFQTLLGDLPIGKVSEPLVSRDGVSVVMVCSRQQQAEALPSDEDIGNMIIQQRVQMESQQLLDDLRHRSVIVQD
ncbi:peptidylprolyl isomerase [Acidocella sp. KAb 2-4]|uniref:peptidylprolyl isomerase n=1 Tax=Acidocella sp. KAb 2-4 TaxID=2885158 RepID=UPI001D0609EA|nr:peptidylprolyl isomerase [Acidocella sp. KAb 2-4]MCB5943464.1 peptidylprolyl isomerase [Acidocella sp. KAb 2-4]